MDANTITLLIAIWGAVLASFTFGWNLYRDLAEKGKLSVSCYIGVIATPGVGIDKENVLIWNVTNIGHRPVMLTHIGGFVEKNKEGFIVQTDHTNPLPKMLQPGEYFIHYLEDYSKVDLENINKLYALDSRGNYYHPSRKQFKETKQKLSKLVAEGKSPKLD